LKTRSRSSRASSGSISFQTATSSRGESLTLSLSAGSRAQNYSVAFSEPFLFDRNITGGANIFRSEVRLHRPVHAAVQRRGRDDGLPDERLLAHVRELQLRARAVTEIADVYQTPDVLAATRSCATRCCSASAASGSSQGRTVVCLQHGRPAIFPTNGKRFTTSIDLAGLGGNTNSTSRWSKGCGSSSRAIV